MSTNYEFKKITDVDVIQKTGDSSYVMVEDAGILKKMAAKNIGAVKTVNGAEPDENGNVQIVMPEVPEINYPVTSVNGQTGDVQIEIPEVKEITVNGVAPDENGNIQLEISASGNQSDWNQMDETSSDYIKNKPFYDAGNPVVFTLFNKENATFEEELNMDQTGVFYAYTPELEEDMDEFVKIQIIEGNSYTITIDENVYTATGKTMEGFGYLGNLSLIISVYPNTGEDFFIAPVEALFALNIPGESHNIFIEETKLVVEKEITPEDDYVFQLMEPDMIPLLINLGCDFSSIAQGDVITTTFDDVEYTNTVVLIENGPLVFGNLSLMDAGEDTGEPFLGLYMQGISGIYGLTPSVQHQFSIDKILSDGSNQNIVPENKYDFNASLDEPEYLMIDNTSGYILEADTNYKVLWNGVEYNCSSISKNIGTEEEPNVVVYLGNVYKFGESETDTGEPFVFGYNSAEGFMGMFIPDQNFTATHQVKVVGLVSDVKKLDKKYIPDDIDLPIASSAKAGAVKVRSTMSGLSNNSNYSKIYLDTDDNTIYAEKPTVPVIQKSTTDLTEGVSSLATGTIYLVYE